jgi:prevent-host-death family protein
VVQINIADAKAHLSVLAERAAAGEEIILEEAGRPVARIVALEKPAAPVKKEPRRPGVARHWVVDDEALLAPMDPEDLDAAEGLHTDAWGITRSGRD